MSMLRSLFFHKTERPAVKAEPGDGVTRVGVQAPAAAPATDVSSLIRAYGRNEIAYACIEIKRKALQDPRLIVEERQSDGTWKEIAGHPMRRLMMRPTSELDEASFLGLASASMDIAGIFYAEKIRSRSKAIVGLNPLNPALMSAWNDRRGVQIGWTWKSGSTRVDFPLEDVLVRKLPGWAAVAPMAVALGATDADTAQTDYLRAFFNQAGVPSGVLTTEQELDPGRAEELRARWRGLFGRGGNRHDIAVLGRGTTYQRMGANLDELDSESVRSLTESRICMAFGVPPLIVYAYVGLLRATYSNLKEAWANFWDSELSTSLKAWRSFFTWSLLTEFVSEDLIYGERIRLAWDLSQVAALQEDVDAAQNRARASFAAGAITLNELRAALGTQPDPAGDYYLRTMSAIAAPVGVLPDAEPAPATETRGSSGPTGTKAAAATRVGRALQRVRLAVAKKMEPRVETFFDDLAGRVVSRARDAGKAREQKDLPTVEQLLLPADGLELGGLFRLFALEVVRASWETWNGALDLELAFDESDPAVAAAMAQAGSRIGGITDTTRDAVRALLQYGAEQGWSIDQLVRGTDERPGLRATVAQSYAGRARTIARSELAMAQNAATHRRYTDAGVDRVQILDGGGDDSDDVCNQLNGSVQTLAWAKANPLQHPNCVRAFAPYFGE
jgi:HK97 family phage portal protein